MTEPIKQEIINNIFENGDKLITGPILQTVLIDMIDDVNGKDQEILSKTGSWDNAVTQIPNLATKEEVTNLSESVARDIANVDVDLTGYATEQWVESQGYLKEHQDISNLATKTELNDTKNNLQGNITSLSESVARDIANVSVPEGVATEAWVQSQDYASKTYVNDAVSSSSVDLTGYATETWVQNQGYLKEHQDISGLATKTELNDTKNNLQGNITSLSESVARDIANVDLTGYATETWVQSQGYLTEHQDISNLATKTELTSVSESVQTDITNLSESVASSAVWKKGEGTDSIVQIIADGTYLPTATGRRAVATGYYTTASGGASHAEGEATKALGAYDHAEGFGTTASGSHNHAEGQNTKASGQGSHAEGNSTIASAHCSHAEGGDTKASGSYSHAEGIYTVALGQASHAEGYRTTALKEGSHAEGESTIASGSYSHAEGGYTTTSNQYEHAQGQYNYTSSNQIFSVGAGEKIGETVTRRNAVSILEVPNSETQVVTSSFFVQNVGGYDGTNPTPGTNDLATVISEVSSIWKKGTGQDSIVQVIADGTNLPTASGERAIATGYGTNASGHYSHAEGQGTTAEGWKSHAEGGYTWAKEDYSHAEGSSTQALGWYSHAEGLGATTEGNASHAEGNYARASGSYSHAEGYYTKASGQASHAEGNHTTASNDYEHAQGIYNHSSTNQIFSVGAGEGNPDDPKSVTRRNAISILAVPNSETQINTASFFVQNVGGYDGTNPIPGTNDLATVINNLPSGGGSSETLWEKGTGTDSIVQKVADGTNLPTATGNRAIATGYNTKASGNHSHAEGSITTASEFSSHAEGYDTNASGSCSHAEGESTIASALCSHAEGGWTKASGDHSHAEGYLANASGKFSHAEGEQTYASGSYSHAEGDHTIATNNYEHAQGTYNHNSTNQIFSVGAGEMVNYLITRRNAISVLAVPNSETQINTASVFIQNIGGYDGTNPTPGTNDLATVLNNTETWTFTLEDGSTVTKTVVMR